MSKKQSTMRLYIIKKLAEILRGVILKNLMTINELICDELRSIKFSYVSYYKQEYIN